jgi:hypothetical protein
MALAGRSTRRGGGTSRVLIIAVVLTLVVLLIDASIKSKSPSTAQRLSGQEWIDQTLPLIKASTQQGEQLAAIRQNGLTMSASAIASQVKQTATAAASTYASAEKLVPPSNYGSAGGFLDACLLLREQAAASFAKSLVATLSGPTTPAASDSTELASAAQKLQSGDDLYQLFAHGLPGLQVQMPSSVWASNADLYETASLSVFLDALRSKTNLTPVHHLVVEALSTTPQAESVYDNDIQVLPNSSSITVDVVVANAGNQVENSLTVVASILPARTAPSVKEFIQTLAPGAAQSLTIGALYPVIGQATALTLTVIPEAGSPTPQATKTLTFEMPSPNTPLTTTTTVAPPSSTANGTPTTSTPKGAKHKGSTTTNTTKDAGP